MIFFALVIEMIRYILAILVALGILGIIFGLIFGICYWLYEKISEDV